VTFCFRRLKANIAGAFMGTLAQSIRQAPRRGNGIDAPFAQHVRGE
jgi:hypothetical protein